MPALAIELPAELAVARCQDELSVGIEHFESMRLDHIGDRLAGRGGLPLPRNRDRRIWVHRHRKAAGGQRRLNPLRRGERCSSPMCRWAFAYFGPTHKHDRLDEDTHMALRRQFGRASLDALAHIASIVRRGEAITAEGASYVRPERLRVPVLFLAGEHNRIFLPSGARRTYSLLRAANPDVPYEFQLLKRYGHLDCMIGRNAHRDVYPFIRAHLDRT